MVLSTTEMIIDQKLALNKSKYKIILTQGGIKNNPKLAIKRSEIPLTQCNFIHFKCRKSVKSNMPTMLEGNCIFVRKINSSPRAKQPKITAQYRIIF